MFLSDFSIKQPVTTVAIVIVLMCLGLLALKNLRVNQIPDVDQPVMVVNFPYPGASPETVEREIVNRVEKALQSIPQVYEIRSTASEGNARIVIIFDFKKEMTEAADEIRNAIASVRYKLPIEMREPVLYRIDPSAQPIMQLALSSERQTHAEISRLAEDVLADRLRGLDGVAVVDVEGSLRRELSVLLHAEKLREFNVSVSDVVNALRAQNTTAPVGRVKGILDEQIHVDGAGNDPGPHRGSDLAIGPSELGLNECEPLGILGNWKARHFDGKLAQTPSFVFQFVHARYTRRGQTQTQARTVEVIDLGHTDVTTRKRLTRPQRSMFKKMDFNTLP